ncbi:haloacid dehalogenase-like hydrolase [Teratosphaeria nubilosa]|uniref:Haloacid dehalogenase-like hydrolase n=1 Tax=Teratosphaeria nubilosa TaxID=161662 RepID=A0A6G1L9U9_9PEZI|nr:haloacid dehalogenase-like hydrolase [Teratosphaeria nubilosa]
MPPPRQRHLLLCFDAFGTLFRPKRPIAQQYSEVARSLGLSGFTDEQVMESFKVAFRKEAKANPNFGKSNGMDARAWWRNIIHNTFLPLVGANQPFHKDLAPRLIHRFSSAEGYDLVPGAVELLRSLRRHPPSGVEHLTIGVITNSDDRVPDVLSSLGLKTSPYRYGSEPPHKSAPHEQVDVDFAVMSYDAGHEKPDRRIFEAAESMLSVIPSTAGMEVGEFEKVYVGDEYEKDVKGADRAGWYAVLVPKEDGSVDTPSDVEVLDESAASGTLLDILRSGRSKVAVDGMRTLARLLTGPS